MDKTRRAQAVRLAAAAFQDDPIYRWLAPDDARRERLLLALMARALGDCAVTTLPDGGALLGVAACHDPEVPALGGGWKLGLLRLMATPRRSWRGYQLLNALHALRPKEPHVHLEVLAVAREARGQGIARRLLDPILERARSRNMLVHLETTNPDNVSLYRRFGFELVTTLERNAPHAWVMQLDAGRASSAAT